MATSDGLWRYLESGRNLAGCVGGAAGLVLYFTGVAGPWWPGVVAGLYGVGALLVPGRRRTPGGPAALTGTAAGTAAAGTAAAGTTAAGTTAAGTTRETEGLRAGLADLTAYLADVDLPGWAGVAELMAALDPGAPGGPAGGDPAALRAARLVVAERLPLAVDGYLRARAWERWAEPGEDPAAVLRREVEAMAGALG